MSYPSIYYYRRQVQIDFLYLQWHEYIIENYYDTMLFMTLYKGDNNITITPKAMAIIPIFIIGPEILFL